VGDGVDSAFSRLASLPHPPRPCVAFPHPESNLPQSLPLFLSLLVLQILPERSYAAPHEAVNVLLDAEGHTAPGGPVTRGQSRAMSSLLDDVLLEMGLHEHSGSVATSASAGELSRWM